MSAAGRPARCSPRKPDHDCIDNIGRVDLIEAARLIAEPEDQGDHWCTRRIEGRPRIRLCVRCHDAAAAEEAAHVKEYQL